MEEDRKGVLFPAGLPTFSRRPPSPRVTNLVRWFWISQWDLPPGRASRQELLPFPALNLVVEDSCVGLSGASTSRSHRDLTGRGWAVGALLRPAATPALLNAPRAPGQPGEPPERGEPTDPTSVLDQYVLLDEPALHAAVARPMSGEEPDVAAACDAFEDWLSARIPAPTGEALLANDLVALIDADPDLLKVEDVARAMSLSVRTVQRLAKRYVGLAPLAMIRRRRLQEAAAALREGAALSLAELAADLGYADQAHLIRDFRDGLGFTPGQYRRSAGS